jgi:hypothetical protein
MKQYFLLIFISIIQSLSAQNTVCFEVEPNPDINDPAFAAFTKYINVFGIRLYGESGISDEKILHGAAILAELLDNDEDGLVDDQALLAQLISIEAFMPFVMSESSVGMDALESNYTGNGWIDILIDDEIHPEGSSATNGFDATLEEMMHLIHTGGLAHVYANTFANTNPSSELRQAMNTASNGGWYIYGPGNPMDINAQEYIYWGLSSLMGAQDYPGRCSEISNEWTLCTPSQFQNGDLALYNLLIDPQYKMPINRPDGNYCPLSNGLSEINFSDNIVTLSPNPTNDVVSLKLSEQVKWIQGDILDIRGHLMMQINENNTDQINFDCTNFSTGIYILQLSTNQGKNTLKFIKQ